jgi:hypothetical protein
LLDSIATLLEACFFGELRKSAGNSKKESPGSLRFAIIIANKPPGSTCNRTSLSIVEVSSQIRAGAALSTKKMTNFRETHVKAGALPISNSSK